MKRFAPALFTGLMACTSVRAELVTFHFTAEVIETQENNVAVPRIDQGGGITAGHTINGSFSIDLQSSAYSPYPDMPYNPNFRQYIGLNNIANLTVEQTGFAAGFVPSDVFDTGITVSNSAGEDYFTYQTGKFAAAADGYRSEFFRLRLDDADGTLLNNGRLPGRLDFAAVDQGVLDWWSSTETLSYRTIARLTSLSVQAAPVPEPDTWTMLAAGLLAVGIGVQRAGAHRRS